MRATAELEVAVAPAPAGHRERRRVWHVAGGVALLGLAAGGLVTQRGLLIDAAGLLVDLPTASVAVLLAVWAAHTLVHGWSQAVALPGATIAQGVVAAETQSAASHALIGGGTIGTGVRLAMFRSWGHSVEASSVAIGAVSVATGTAMWLMPVVVLVPLILAGSAPSGAGYVVGAASLVLVVSTAGWVLLVHHPRATSRLGGWADTALGPLRRRWSGIPHLEPLAAGARVHARELVRRGGARLLAVSVLQQVTLAAILVACVWAVGVPGVSVGDTVVVVAVLRVAVSFMPLPGGIGVVDLGLLAALTRAGAPETEAAAAVLAFRGLTYVLPVLTGAAAVVWWRTARRR